MFMCIPMGLGVSFNWLAGAYLAVGNSDYEQQPSIAASAARSHVRSSETLNVMM